MKLWKGSDPDTPASCDGEDRPTRTAELVEHSWGGFSVRIPSELGRPFEESDSARLWDGGHFYNEWNPLGSPYAKWRAGVLGHVLLHLQEATTKWLQEGIRRLEQGDNRAGQRMDRGYEQLRHVRSTYLDLLASFFEDPARGAEWAAAEACRRIQAYAEAIDLQGSREALIHVTAGPLIWRTFDSLGLLDPVAAGDELSQDPWVEDHLFPQLQVKLGGVTVIEEPWKPHRPVAVQPTIVICYGSEGSALADQSEEDWLYAPEAGRRLTDAEGELFDVLAGDEGHDFGNEWEIIELATLLANSPSAGKFLKALILEDGDLTEEELVDAAFRLPEPAVEIVLALLPDWSGTVDQLLDAAKQLAEAGQS